MGICFLNLFSIFCIIVTQNNIPSGERVRVRGMLANGILSPRSSPKGEDEGSLIDNVKTMLCFRRRRIRLRWTILRFYRTAATPTFVVKAVR